MIQTNVPLAPYTYSKIGGIAEHLVVVKSALQIQEAVSVAIKNRWPVTLLGSASNVLISDQGLKGLVIINRAQGLKILPGSQVLTEAGALMSQLVNFTLKHGLAGLEEFLGLPGTVGGAIYNNSHHLNHLIGDHIHVVQALDQKGDLRQLTAAQCHFAYDDSVFQHEPWFIVSATFSLKPGDPALLQTLALNALKRRRLSQPLEYPSAGCMFKNLDSKTALANHLPPGITAAGWLIDQSGCKGLTVGGARISQKHANFIINVNKAKAADYVALSNQVRRRVHDRFGVWLKREIFFLGSHPGLET